MRFALSIGLAVACWACAGKAKPSATAIPERVGPAICSDVWPELPRPDAGVSPFAPAVQEQREGGAAVPAPDGGAP